MLQTSAAPENNKDIDRADKLDKWQTIAILLALLLVVAVIWILMTQNQSSEIKASVEASQKFTLAQQVAAACTIKEQADDLGGLCASATQIVKEGPAGNTGPQGSPGTVGAQGPLGPKGEPGLAIQGLQGIQGIQGTQGIQGLLGKGINGETGAVGPQGEPGLGTSGTSGKDGTNGTNGVDGAPGATGAQGTSGTPAFPFKFTFTEAGNVFTCNITAPEAIATCVETIAVP